MTSPLTLQTGSSELYKRLSPRLLSSVSPEIKLNLQLSHCVFCFVFLSRHYYNKIQGVKEDWDTRDTFTFGKEKFQRIFFLFLVLCLSFFFFFFMNWAPEQLLRGLVIKVW